MTTPERFSMGSYLFGPPRPDAPRRRVSRRPRRVCGKFVGSLSSISAPQPSVRAEEAASFWRPSRSASPAPRSRPGCGLPGCGAPFETRPGKRAASGRTGLKRPRGRSSDRTGTVRSAPIHKVRGTFPTNLTHTRPYPPAWRRTHQRVSSLSLPPTLLREAEQVAKDQGRTTSELFREALRRYLPPPCSSHGSYSCTLAMAVPPQNNI